MAIKSRQYWLTAVLLATSLGLGACSTLGDGSRQSEEPPTLKVDTPLDKALQAAIRFGGETTEQTKRLVKQRRQHVEAAALLAEALKSNVLKYEHQQLINAMSLYITFAETPSPEVFSLLVRSGRPLANQLGWHMVSVRPSPTLAKAIEFELTRAISENEEQAILLPQMANALRANHVRNAYTFARQGLMVKGQEEFAKAMIDLDGRKASDDFLAYLAMAPAEELRQLALTSVNIYSCLVILNHMSIVPPTISNQYFSHLYYYAVSRNAALADLAQNIIESYVPSHTDYLAQLLSRHPTWVQMAYLENARRRLSPKVGLLLGELKKVSAENDVILEINEIWR